jgi:spore maturation protein CgeB
VSQPQYRYVFLGLSITSSWGNGHATTYRGLIRQLAARGHQITFLERDAPSYAAHRDLPKPSYAQTHLYGSFEELVDKHRAAVRDADLVVVGSSVPEGARIGEWVNTTTPGRTAFYDIDTPITLATLDIGDNDHLTRALVQRYALYLSFTGGPTLATLHDRYGAQLVRPLYCSADPDQYYPDRTEEPDADLGYLGTYSLDRQPALERMVFEPARCWADGRFLVAGAQYPSTVTWPENVQYTPHIAPDEHRRFFAAQRYTLNITRSAMIQAGHSPSVRLFEAAACGTPIISDPWPGLDQIFEPGREIVVARSGADVLRYLRDINEHERRSIANAARGRFLREHTSMHRAESLEQYTGEVLELQARRARAAKLPQPRLSS